MSLYAVGIAVIALMISSCAEDEAASKKMAASDAESGAMSAVITEDAIRTATATLDGKRIENANEEPGNWLAHGRTYDEGRHSPLTEINADNVTPFFILHPHRKVVAGDTGIVYKNIYNFYLFYFLL